MTLAERLNALEVDAHATKGVVDLIPMVATAFDGPDDELRPEYHWLFECKTYLDRDHSDEPFTYYVEYKGEAARWNANESEWQKTRV